MRIAVTKQNPILKQLAYEALATGTISDVWMDDEAASADQKTPKQKPQPAAH